MIDARLIPDAQEVITPGEAVAGMIRNGLGVANRPVSLTPQFFASTPLDLWFREGIRAVMFNRLTRGRTLDASYAYGGDLRFQELALAVCAQAGIDLRCNPLDTTRVSLRGDDVPDRDEHAMTSTHGDAKDHRPDCKQAVLARLVSPDGGVPGVSKRWDGHPSDTQIFQERAQALMTAVQPSPGPQSLIAESQLDHEAKAANLHTLGFLTRLPHTSGVVSQVITPALRWDTWQHLEATTRYPRLEWCHAGRAQRWLVVYSQAARARAEATLAKARQRAYEAIAQQLLHWQAQRFPSPEAAQEALAALATGWRDHQVTGSHRSAHQRDAGQGRPTPHTPRKARAWNIQAHARPDDAAMERLTHGNACFVLGSTIDTSQVSDPEVIRA
jgi:transposase